MRTFEPIPRHEQIAIDALAVLRDRLPRSVLLDRDLAEIVNARGRYAEPVHLRELAVVLGELSAHHQLDVALDGAATEVRITQSGERLLDGLAPLHGARLVTWLEQDRVVTELRAGAKVYSFFLTRRKLVDEEGKDRMAQDHAQGMALLWRTLLTQRPRVFAACGARGWAPSAASAALGWAPSSRA